MRGRNGDGDRRTVNLYRLNCKNEMWCPSRPAILTTSGLEEDAVIVLLPA